MDFDETTVYTEIGYNVEVSKNGSLGQKIVFYIDSHRCS